MSPANSARKPLRTASKDALSKQQNDDDQILPQQAEDEQIRSNKSNDYDRRSNSWGQKVATADQLEKLQQKLSKLLEEFRDM